jgi:endo-1,4-beta-D-glucanase Y
LAGRSSGLFQQARKISASVGEFITSINLFLESEELLVPLREIQKGINELTAERVEKQINYLIRIFENNFEEVIDRRIKKAEATLHEEIKLLKNLNKNLEAEILSIKGNRNQDESKVYELSMRVAALNDKTAKLANEKTEIERILKAEQAAAE